MQNATVRIAGITTESVVDGPGLRSTVFFQGCSHACPDCHNPETWDPMGGSELTLAMLIHRLRINPLTSGVTFSGGDPFFQAVAAAKLGRYLKSEGLNLWVYTGYTWEYLLKHLDQEGFKDLLACTDVLVDGPFIGDQKVFHIPFRGSSNQRTILVSASFDLAKIIEWQPEQVRITI